MIVRPHEYIIGRLNGTYLQSDPLLYRHYKRSMKNAAGSIYHDDGHNNETASGAILDNIAHESVYGNMRQQQPTKSNNGNRMFYPQSEPPFQTSHNPSDTLKTSDKMLKLKELNLLVNKHYSPQNADLILRGTVALSFQGNDDFIDKQLEFLRNIDKAKS